MPNYRQVYKSDHLGVVDLEEMIEAGKPLIFTIKEVKQEIGATVAGSKGNFNIAYFTDGTKPLVLNATNAHIVRKLGGGSTDTDNWKMIPVELYIDSTVKMKGQIVGGVRIKSISPQPAATPVSDINGLAVLSQSTTLDELQQNWNKLTTAEKNLPTILAKKDSLKKQFSND